MISWWYPLADDFYILMISSFIGDTLMLLGELEFWFPLGGPANWPTLIEFPFHFPFHFTMEQKVIKWVVISLVIYFYAGHYVGLWYHSGENIW